MSIRSRRQAEQVMRLDQLEPLVHQRRRIDRDLRAHRPFGMRDRLLRRRRPQLLRRRGAGTARRWQSGSVLRHLRVLLPQGTGISHYVRCRPAAASARCPSRRIDHQLTGGDQRFLVGERDRLPGLDRGHHRQQAGAADDRRDHQVRIARRGLGQGVARPRRPGSCCRQAARAARADAPRRRSTARRAPVVRAASASALALVCAVSATTSKRSGERPTRSSVDWPTDPVAPRIEMRFFKSHPPRPPAAVRIATGNRPSSRSKMPPCPGSQRPESLIPARRFIQLSNRSPALRGDRHQRRQQQQDPVQSDSCRPSAAEHACRDDAAVEARPGLARADRRRQLRPADRLADEIGADVGRPDDDEHPHHQRQAVVGAVADPQQRNRGGQRIDEAAEIPAGAPAARRAASIRRKSPVAAAATKTAKT